MLATILGEDTVTLTFRITVLVSVIGGLGIISTFAWKLLDAIRDKAKFAQRVENHLIIAEPLIDQFKIMQIAVASGEDRHKEMTLRLDRWIENQGETNRELHRGIERLTDYIMGQEKEN